MSPKIKSRELSAITSSDALEVGEILSRAADGALSPELAGVLSRVGAFLLVAGRASALPTPGGTGELHPRTGTALELARNALLRASGHVDEALATLVGATILVSRESSAPDLVLAHAISGLARARRDPAGMVVAACPRCCAPTFVLGGAAIVLGGADQEQVQCSDPTCLAVLAVRQGADGIELVEVEPAAAIAAVRG